MKSKIALYAITAVLLSCRAEDTTNNLAEDPATNAPANKPVDLQSLKNGQPPVPPPSARPAPAQAKAAPTAPAAPPKPVAIVIYGAYLFQVSGQPVWIIPERYLFDMTNIYKGHYQVFDEVGLPKP